MTKAATATTTAVDLYSVGNAAGTVNIHPLTNFIIKAWYEAKGTTVAAAFANPSATNNTPPTTTEVTVIKQVVKNLVANWLALDGVDPNTFDLITTPFNANQTQFDRFLDKVKVVDASTLSLNTTGATNPAYQIVLNGATTSGGTYTSVVKAYSAQTLAYTTVTTVSASLIGTTASPYMGAWTLISTMTTAGTCGGTTGVPNPALLAQVDSYGNIFIRRAANPTVITASGTVSASGTISGNIYGDSLIAAGLCPAGTFNGTMTTVNAGAGTYTQTPEAGTFTLTRVTASAYAGAWVIQGRLTSTSASQCGSVAADVGKIMATEPVVVGLDGSFVMMSKQYPGYVDARGMIDTLGSLTMTFYGDSNKPFTGTCPASTSSSGTMSSLNYGTGTVSQGGDVIGITLTRGTTATVGAIVGSWFGTDPGNGVQTVITFLANGEFVRAANGATSATFTTGMQRGFYNWNASTGLLTSSCPLTVNTIDPLAACVGENRIWAVSGNTLSPVGDPVSLARVAADATKPIIGSWTGADALTGHKWVITFMANGEYVHAEDGPSATNFQSGMERGTYTWNASTGAFATGGCPAVDTNGESGLSHQTPGVCSANTGSTWTVSGNTLTAVDPTPVTGGTFIFAHVVP